MKPLLLLIVLCFAVSCQTQERVRVEGQRSESFQSIQSVEYLRTGGIAGAEDKITISPTGELQTTGRLLGEGMLQLSDFQIARLARLFEGWDKLEAEYAPPKGARDAFTTQITYGGKSVKVSDATIDPPEQFVQARRAIEAYLREIQAPKQR